MASRSAAAPAEAFVGLTWATALRGWMARMAGDESQFHWYGTFALLVAPGLLVGALIGLAEHRHRIGGSPSPWLTLSPCLFLAALADPAIFKALITNAFGVVLFGLAGGYAPSGRGGAEPILRSVALSATGPQPQNHRFATTCRCALGETSAAILRRVFPAMSRGRPVARIVLACGAVRSFLAWPGDQLGQ